MINDKIFEHFQSISKQIENTFSLPYYTYRFGENPAEASSFYLNTSYQAGSRSYREEFMTIGTIENSKNLVITCSNPNIPSMQVLFYSMLYWEELAKQLSLSFVSFRFIKNVNWLGRMEIVDFFTGLGYQKRFKNNLKKKITRSYENPILTMKRDVHQCIIDLMFEDQTVRFEYSGDPWNFYFKVYYCGVHWELEFKFTNSSFVISCDDLGMLNTAIPGNPTSFMQQLFDKMNKITRIRNLYSSPKYHFNHLMKKTGLSAVSSQIYEHLLTTHSSNDIELECSKLGYQPFYQTFYHVTSLHLLGHDYIYDRYTETLEITSLNNTQAFENLIVQSYEAKCAQEKLDFMEQMQHELSLYR